MKKVDAQARAAASPPSSDEAIPKDAKNTKARPGFGSDRAMENAVTMLMYHAIVTSDYINDKDLLKGVFDRVKEDFKTPSEQRVHLGKLPCKCRKRNYESNTTC